MAFSFINVSVRISADLGIIISLSLDEMILLSTRGAAFHHAVYDETRWLGTDFVLRQWVLGSLLCEDLGGPQPTTRREFIFGHGEPLLNR